MKKSGWLVFACLLGGPAVGLLQEQKIDFEAKNGEYSDGTSRLKIVGVCHVQELSQECWDLSGKLSKSVEGVYLASRTNRDQLYISLGKRNLILLMESSAAYGPQMRFFPGDGFISGEGNGVHRLAVDPTQTTFSVVAELPNGAVPEPLDITLDRAKPTDVAGVQWKFLKSAKLDTVKRTPEGYYYENSGSTNFWSLVYETTGTATWSKFGVGVVQIVGKDGKVILFVDRNGKPLADTDVVAMGGAPGYSNNPNQPKPKIFRATAGRIMDVSVRAAGFRTNVDPKYVAALRQVFTGTNRVLFRDIPAVPTK